MVAAGACLGAGSARGARSADIVSPSDFARNPVGIDFDPDELVAKVRGGASYEEMHHRVEGPRTTPTPRPVEGVHF